MKFRKTIISICFLAVFISQPFCKTQANFTRILSLDTGYLLKGIKNNGWGLGFTYEQFVLPFLSAQGSFYHSTFALSGTSIYCVSVGLSLSGNCYPMNKGLDGFYFGFGCTTDFLNFVSKEVLPFRTSNTVISLVPVVGWKINFPHFTLGSRDIGVMLDLYTNYKLVIVQTYKIESDSVKDYLSNGLNFGFRVKIGIGKVPLEEVNESITSEKI